MKVQKQMWKLFASKHWGIRKTLRIDNKMCDIILSNKAIFKGMVIHQQWGDYPKFFTANVCGQKVVAGVYTLYKKHNIKDYNRCYGTIPRRKGTFNFECRDMKHLSHFLTTLAAWLAKGRRGLE